MHKLSKYVWHAIGESWPFGRENLFSQKKPRNSVFVRTKISIPSHWEDLEAKLLTPGKFWGFPWKLLGITVQTSYWEGRRHQNWVRSRPTKKMACGHATSWKTEIFRKSLRTLRFSTGNFFGASTLKILTPNMAKYVFLTHIWAGQIWSSGVSLKRSCKMQFKRVGLRSIGPSSQKLWPNLIFGPIAKVVARADL